MAGDSTCGNLLKSGELMEVKHHENDDALLSGWGDGVDFAIQTDDVELAGMILAKGGDLDTWVLFEVENFRDGLSFT
jgi:hypothetical protein